nr:uncharacterized protein LOC113808421 [Penaeus vannamei]
MKTLIAVLLVACVAAEQKREAEPSYGHGVGLSLPHGVVSGRHYGVGYGHAAIAHHPYGGRSFVQSYSHNLHKREAQPGYSHPAYGYGYDHSHAFAPAIAHHPYGGRSFVQSFNHNLHKREAEPSFGLPSYGYGYGGGIGYGIGIALDTTSRSLPPIWRSLLHSLLHTTSSTSVTLTQAMVTLTVSQDRSTDTLSSPIQDNGYSYQQSMVYRRAFELVHIPTFT